MQTCLQSAYVQIPLDLSSQDSSTGICTLVSNRFNVRLCLTARSLALLQHVIQRSFTC